MEKLSAYNSATLPNRTVLPGMRSRSVAIFRHRRSLTIATARRSIVGNGRLILFLFALMALFVVLYNQNLIMEQQLRQLMILKKEKVLSTTLLEERYYQLYSLASVETLNRVRGHLVPSNQVEYIIPKKEKSFFHNPFKRLPEYYKIDSIGF